MKRLQMHCNTSLSKNGINNVVMSKSKFDEALESFQQGGEYSKNGVKKNATFYDYLSGDAYNTSPGKNAKTTKTRRTKAKQKK